jgi:NADPH:quinone reductase-like Zn-dependent oxidoreductase
VEIKERFMARFWPLLEIGDIQPVIDSVYPIDQANQAHRRMAENRNIGKIVLKVR